MWAPSMARALDHVSVSKVDHVSVSRDDAGEAHRFSPAFCLLTPDFLGILSGLVTEIDGQDARPGHDVVQRDTPLSHDRVSQWGEAAAALVRPQHSEH